MSSPSFLRPLGFGEVLDGAFTIYRQHFAVLFASALIGSVPLTLASGALTATIEGPSNPAAGTILLALLGIAVVLCGSMLLSAVLTRQIANAVTGGLLTVADGYVRAIVRLPQLLGAYVLLVLIVGGVMFAAAIIGAVMVGGAAFLLTMAGGGQAGGAVTPLVIGAITVVLVAIMGVTMLVVLSAYFAIVPAVILENQGPVAALGRSWRLARGAYLRIVGILVVAWIILALPSMGLSALAGIGGTGFFNLATDSGSLTTVAYIGQQVLGILIGALTWPFYVSCVTLLYFDRRVRTEALDVEIAADALPSRG